MIPAFMKKMSEEMGETSKKKSPKAGAMKRMVKKAGKKAC